MIRIKNKKLFLIFFGLVVCLLVLKATLDDILFNFYYKKAKNYFSLPPEVQLTTIPSCDHIFENMEKVLVVNPNNKKALLNVSWYMLRFIGDSTKLIRSYHYIQKLKSMEPENPVYLMMEFKFYDQIAENYFIQGEFLFDFSFKQTALDTLPILAKIYKDKFRNIHYVRLNILPYLEFPNFTQREDYLVETLKIYEDEKYKQNLKAFLKELKFIEIVGSPQWQITYFNQIFINNFLEDFYNPSIEDHFRASYYHINFNLDNRKPDMDKFPEKYKAILANLDRF